MNKDFNFPVFTVFGDDFFDQEAEAAIKLRLAINKLTDELDDFDSKLDKIGKKLNIYINNIIKLTQPFNYLKHTILFNDNNAKIYKFKTIDQLLEKIDANEISDEELYNLLPEPIVEIKLNQKQLNRCMNLIEEYNEVYMDYDYSSCEMEECLTWYNEIIDDVKESLSEIKLLDVSKNNNNFISEPFNDELHEILITYNSKNDKWQFVYLRKEDKDKFINIVKSNG